MRTPPRALLALLAAAGCAGADPGLRVAEPPHAAAAADVDRADLTFTARDGLALYAQRWRPRTGEPRAVVVIHHGLADHSDRYAGFAERLVRAGYAVWALDMRGHGRSAGVRVRVDRIDDLLDDLDAFVALVRGREPGRPIVLYGHSLGGLVTALYAIERSETGVGTPTAPPTGRGQSPRGIERSETGVGTPTAPPTGRGQSPRGIKHHPAAAGVVLAAPGITFDAPPIQAGAVPLVAAIAPGAPVLEVPHAQFSVDPRVVAEMDGLFVALGYRNLGGIDVWGLPRRRAVGR